MANVLFPAAREGFLAGEIDFDDATIKVALVRGYTYNAAHKFVSDVTGASGVLHVTSDPLDNKTITGGVADADDVTLEEVESDEDDHDVLLFQSSAVGGGSDVAASAQRLIALIDTGTNIPVRPNGGDVTIQWDSGANRIFAL